MSSPHIIEVWGIPTCGTTRKALKYLETRKIPHVFKNYREIRPTRQLLHEAMRVVSDPRKMFNTSGGSYRDGGYKEKAATMTPAQIIDALLADPMLIKRPIVTSPKGIVVGYDEAAIGAIL
jgi:arsenate reductase (glutaredoxin)